MRTNPRLFGRLILGGFTLILSCITPAVAADRGKALDAYREGNSLFDQGRFTEAVQAYNQAIAEDPQYAQASHNLALASEMVDHQQAVDAWKRFIDIAASREDLKYDVARARARLQLLESMPTLPESMHPSHYVSADGDYYWQVSTDSEGDEWNHLPLKVFLGSAPNMKWQEGAREAYDIWSAVFPLQIVAKPQDADIRMGWEASTQEYGHAGEEMDWVQFKYAGDQISRRRIAVLTVDVSRPWSKDEMRAIVMHELGHAFGIKGHSDSKKDIMFWQLQDRKRSIAIPGSPVPFSWRSLVKKPSQRDLNTLIRLYNSAGSSKRFP
jgi:predicted Zn-dependent protease